MPRYLSPKKHLESAIKPLYAYMAMIRQALAEFDDH